MKRILHILGSMNRGGAETFIMNVYRHIDRTQFQFDFLLHQKNNDYEAEIKELGGKIYTIPSRRELGVVKFFKILSAFFRMQSGKYSAVHQHLSSLSSIEPLIVSKYYNIPIRIIHSHSTNQSGVIHRILHYCNKPFIHLYATHFFACSKVAHDWLYNGTFVKKRAIVVNNGIDSSAFSFQPKIRERVRAAFKVEDKELLFGHVGRFSKVKNHTFLLDVFASYVDKYDNANLILIGQGELQNEIKTKVDTLNLQDKVIFAGLRTDINELLQAIDIFVFPSHYEGLPVALVEAQVAGVKVYGSDRISRESELTPNIEFLSLENSAERWATAIHDDFQYFERKDMSQIIVEQGYDIKTTVKMLQKIY